MTKDFRKYRLSKGGPQPTGVNGALVDLRYQNFNKSGLYELLTDLKSLTPEEVRTSEYLIANIWSIPHTMHQWMPNFPPSPPSHDDYREITLQLQKQVYRLLGVPDFGENPADGIVSANWS